MGMHPVAIYHLRYSHVQNEQSPIYVGVGRLDHISDVDHVRPSVEGAGQRVAGNGDVALANGTMRVLRAPEANEMVVTIMAAVAQAERRMISERTKAALRAAKARGRRLGRPAGSIVPRRDEGSKAGGAAMQIKADTFAADLRPVLDELTDLSANAAAAELTRRGYPTPRGGKWTAGKIINVRARLVWSRD